MEKRERPQGFVVLASMSNAIEANLVKAQLETEGIECALENENMGDVFMGNAEQGVIILVHENDLKRAKLIMDVEVELPDDFDAGEPEK